MEIGHGFLAEFLMKFVVRICDGDGLRILAFSCAQSFASPLFAIVVARLEPQPKTLSLLRICRLSGATTGCTSRFGEPQIDGLHTISETSTLSTRRVIKGSRH